MGHRTLPVCLCVQSTQGVVQRLYLGNFVLSTVYGKLSSSLCESSNFHQIKQLFRCVDEISLALVLGRWKWLRYAMEQQQQYIWLMRNAII